MGCENCYNFNQENEISTSKIQNNNSLNKDIESKELILSAKETTFTNENNTIYSFQSISKKLIKIQNNQFNSEILDEINKYRLRHGVEKIIMDENINKIAQRYAEKLARESELELSGNKYNEKDLGEIIFSCQDGISPKELVDLWYNDGSINYNYNKEPNTSKNFTQLIWKNTKLFGIGHATTRDNKLYIVANFYPEGNIKGQFLKNVLPSNKRKNSNISKSDDNSFYSFTTKFLEEALFSHNELRANHNSPPLDLNPNLSILAQNHSDFLAKEGKLIYSNNKIKNEDIGENLFMSKKKCSGEEVTSFWYKGIKNYNFNKGENNEKNDEINNFTQLIWKNTKEVGFGFSYDRKGNFYVVANYFPSGNIEGQYQNNVLPD